MHLLLLHSYWATSVKHFGLFGPFSVYFHIVQSIQSFNPLWSTPVHFGYALEGEDCVERFINNYVTISI